jgi:hypothetical protein
MIVAFLRLRAAFAAAIITASIAAAAAQQAASALPPGGPGGTVPHTPTPTPSPRKQGNPGSQGNPSLTAPGQPHYTTNFSTCAQQGGTSAQCGTLLRGWVAFYWTYACGGCNPTGFTLRRADAPAATRPNGPAGTLGVATVGIAQEEPRSSAPLTVIAPPSKGWSGECYIVVAYRQTGGSSGEPHQVGTTSGGSIVESAPSQKVCLGETTRVVTIPAAASRGYSRTYFIKGNDRGVEDHAYAAQPYSLGNRYVSYPGGVTDILYWYSRVAVAFDRASIGGATIFKGAIAYDASLLKSTLASGCAVVFSPAPSGWEGATWIAPQGARYKTSFAMNGSTFSAPIDGLLQNWKSGQLSIMLRELAPAETTNYMLGPLSYTCPPAGNIRLVVTLGVDE